MSASSNTSGFVDLREHFELVEEATAYVTPVVNWLVELLLPGQGKRFLIVLAAGEDEAWGRARDRAHEVFELRGGTRGPTLCDYMPLQPGKATEWLSLYPAITKDTRTEQEAKDYP